MKVSSAICLALLFCTSHTASSELIPEECNSVDKLLQNRIDCDNQSVQLTGTVTNFAQKISASGNPYAVFTLSDVRNSIKVYVRGNISLENNGVVQIKGKFYHIFKQGKDIFFDEVQTESKDITIVAKNNQLPTAALAVAFLLVLCVYLFWVIRKKMTPTQDNNNKNAFEKYVLFLFNDSKWRIIRWTADFSKEIKRGIKSDSEPDLILEHRKTGKIFAVECKHRKNWFEGKKGRAIKWADVWQIRKYVEFQEKKGYPTRVIIGVGGTSEKPNQLFNVPLHSLKYPIVHKNYLKRFERETDKEFNLNEYGILI